MKDEFKLILDLKKTIIYLDKIVINFPNNERVLKDKIMGSIYDVLELSYMANEINNFNRVIYQKKIVTKIKMIDFYFKLCLDKKYINYKKYIKINNILLNNLKQIYGWIKYEKKEQYI